MKMYKILILGLLIFGSVFSTSAQPEVDHWDEKIQLSISDMNKPKVAAVSSGCDWIPPFLDDWADVDDFRDYIDGLSDADFDKILTAWKVLLDDDIPEVIRTNIENLKFIKNYLNKLPNSGNLIKIGVKNATNKQNWLDLFELEDIAKLENLAKNGVVKFTGIENVTWSKSLVTDLVEELKSIKLDLGDEFGRFDEIEIDIVTVSVDNPLPDVGAAAAYVYDIFPNGAIINRTLRINSARIESSNSYAQYLNKLENDGTVIDPSTGTVDIVPKNLRDVIHHEIGHVLTEPNNAMAQWVDEFEILEPLLKKLSYNATTGVDEAFAEIFTAYKANKPVDDYLIDFFNEYKNTNFPDIE